MGFSEEFRPRPDPDSLEIAVSGNDSALLPSFETYRKRNPEEFLDFLRKIPVEELLYDRSAQAALDRILELHFGRDEKFAQMAWQRGGILVQNPYPVLSLRSKGASIWVHGAFMLEDGEYFYYFNTWWPGRDIPDYLRPEDIVSSGQLTPTFPGEVREKIRKELGISEEMVDCLIYDTDDRAWKHVVPLEIPFNKPFNRVSSRGGIAERFNTRRWKWEPNGDGVYRPDVKQRLRIASQKLANRLFDTATRHGDEYSLPE